MAASRLNEIVAIDCTLLDRDNKSKENALIMTDIFTKFTQEIPPKDQPAQTTAQALIRYLISVFGAPRRLYSDQGCNFESSLI